MVVPECEPSLNGFWKELFGESKAELREKIHCQELENENLKAERNILRRHITSLQNDIVESERVAKGVYGQLTATQQAGAGYRDQIAELSISVATAGKIIRDLQERIHDLTKPVRKKKGTK